MIFLPTFLKSLDVGALEKVSADWGGVAGAFGDGINLL